MHAIVSCRPRAGPGPCTDKRRALRIRAEANEEQELWPKLRDEASNLDVSHSRVSRAGDYTTTAEADADALLAETAEYASTARRDVG